MQKFNILFIPIALMFLNYPAIAGDEHGHDHDAEQKQTLSAAKIKQLKIPVLKAKPENINVYLSLFGKISLHPDYSLHAHAKFPGIVRNVFKGVGEQVKAGEVLARIENSRSIQVYNLVSPISGVVLEKNIAEGQSISEDVEAFIVGDTSKLLTTFTAYPRDLKSIQLGSTIHIYSESTNLQAESKISYISPILDEYSRTAKIHAVLENPENLWRSGQFVTGSLVTSVKAVSLSIPISALTEPKANSDHDLWVKIGKEFFPRKISVGLVDDKNAEVLSGLEKGEKFLDIKISELRKKTADNHKDEDAHSHEEKEKDSNHDEHED